MSPGSLEAARRAAGAVVTAIDLVMAGEVDNAFCAVRPPGHHAEPGRAMGFCIFNNVAIGAFHARQAHGLGKIAVVDFDVHHGNGTQAAFWDDEDMFFASSHQSPFYPGTGRESETGVGNIHNAELAAGTGSREFRMAWERRLLPALDAFAPELLLISAGFDAHIADPLAQLALTTEDYRWISDALVDLAAKHCNGRVVSTLEGGYDLDALAEASAAHVRSLEAATQAA
jgi:acetoin utilization deacetylase AcuC-like enzyme